MNENAKNRNPEEIRQEKLFKIREEQRAAAHREATAKPISQRQTVQPIRKRAKVPAIYRAFNMAMARRYGIKSPGAIEYK